MEPHRRPASLSSRECGHLVTDNLTASKGLQDESVQVNPTGITPRISSLNRDAIQNGGTIMNKVKMSGAVLATVVGLMFAAGPVLAQDSSSQANVKCIGGNS